MIDLTKLKRHNPKDYIKKQVALEGLDRRKVDICAGCDLRNQVTLECSVANDRNFQCWNDDTHNGVIQQFVYIKKKKDDSQ